MVILLIALSVASVLAFEYLNRRDRGRSTVEERLPGAGQMRDVEGYSLPSSLHFHPLHTWALVEDSQTARVGVDDLARRLLGPADKITLPMTGAELEQGMGCALMRGGGRVAAVAAPVGGEIVEVNRELKNNPDLAFKEPFGRGWLVKIRSWRLAEQLSGLLAGKVAANWLAGSARRVRMAIGGALGETALDGGELVENIGKELDDGVWSRLAERCLGNGVSITVSEETADGSKSWLHSG